MPHTILLAKVAGLFLVIVGIAILVRRQDFMDVAAAFARERLTRVVISTFELLGALFLVIMHNEWSPLPAALISLFGWLALIESAVYLMLPHRVVEALVGGLSVPAIYVLGGIAAIAIGAYLAAWGFGLY